MQDLFLARGYRANVAISPLRIDIEPRIVPLADSSHSFGLKRVIFDFLSRLFAAVSIRTFQPSQLGEAVNQIESLALIRAPRLSQMGWLDISFLNNIFVNALRLFNGLNT